MRTGPSAADIDLVAHARSAGVDGVTPTKLERWRSGRWPLLPKNRRVGRSSEPVTGAAELVAWLGREARPGRRPYDLALLAFADGHPVPEPTVRWAFRRTVEQLRLPGEERGPDADDDVEDWAATVAADALDRDMEFTVVPRRVRAIDERLTAAGLDWSPEPAAVLDEGPLATDLTRRDFATTAVSAVLAGPDVVPGADAGAFARMLAPSGAASPIASMLERGGETEASDTGVIDEVGAITFMPGGDMRSTLTKLVDEAEVSELRDAWTAAESVREWALDLCAATEHELDQEIVGPAVQEWVTGALMSLPRLAMVDALRGSRWTPSDRAFKAVMLLMMRDMVRRLEALVPDGDFSVLGDVMPQCLHAFVGAPASPQSARS